MGDTPELSTVISEFRDALRGAGLQAHKNTDIVADGVLHRYQVDTDKGNKKNGWYILYYDERPAGKFGSWKETTHIWTMEGATPLSDEDRARMRAEQAERKRLGAIETAKREAKAAEQAVAMWEAAAEAESHPYLDKKGLPPLGARVGTFRKSLQPGPNGEERFMEIKGALLIPLRDGREIVGLQAIYAKPIQYGGEERGKDFIYGARKRGCSFPLGKPTELDGRVTILLAEGYATANTLHQATGLATLICFDGGNLQPVAEKLRALLPAARIVICADNDAWTMKSDKVTPWNPGVEKAKAAADAVMGEIVVPVFADVTKKPTDFDDLRMAEGLEEVERQLMAILRPSVEEAVTEGPEPPAPPPEADERMGPPMRTIDDDDETKDNDGFFRVLGHDRDHLYIYQYEKKMVVRRGEADWSESALVTLASLQWWEREFPKGKEAGFDKKAAHNWLVRTAYKRGPYDPTKVRGRGVWMDEGRVVVHSGRVLTVDGVKVNDLRIDSQFIYEQAAALREPSEEAMTSAEGREIVEIMRAASWTRPASGVLAAGWLAVACLGGAMRWRPHIWITGGAGAGKSTLQDVMNFLLGGWPVYAQGNSTEAGVRQTMKIDARPLMMDETEQNNEREGARMQSIIATARQGSSESEAKTLKGTQGGVAMEFDFRSPVCFSSIQVNLLQKADQERFSILSLKSARGEGAAERWAKMKVQIAALKANRELPARLLKRAIDNLPTTIENIDVFTQAAAEAFESQRDGDQYGVLLAGAWSLVSTNLATLKDARDMIARYDWGEYRESSEVEESTKALNTLLGRLIRVRGNDVSVFELIQLACDLDVDGVGGLGAKDARSTLLRYGMKVKWGDRPGTASAKLMVAYPDYVPELAKLMEGTPFAADVKGQLARVEGAEKANTERFLAVSSRCISIPMPTVLGIDPVITVAPVSEREEQLSF